MSPNRSQGSYEKPLFGALLAAQQRAAGNLSATPKKPPQLRPLRIAAEGTNAAQLRSKRFPNAKAAEKSYYNTMCENVLRINEKTLALHLGHLSPFTL